MFFGLYDILKVFFLRRDMARVVQEIAAAAQRFLAGLRALPNFPDLLQKHQILHSALFGRRNSSHALGDVRGCPRLAQDDGMSTEVLYSLIAKETLCPRMEKDHCPRMKLLGYEN